MKLTMKLFLLVTLFCGTALADGEMGGGGIAPGEMGGGGVVAASTDKTGVPTTSDEIVVLFTKYILTILV